jgi:translation elongation factor EF-1alpha
MQSYFKNDIRFKNLSILGSLNSGKCTLAKSISIVCNCISTPNNFSFNGENYYIMPIPCIGEELNEKYNLSSNLSDIALIVIDIKDLIGEFNNKKFYHEILFDLFHKRIANIIICFNKIDNLIFSKELYFECIEKINGLITQNSSYFEIFPSNKTTINYIPISAKESINLIENANLNVKFPWYEGETLLNLLHTIKLQEENENKILFIINDFYKDEDYFVISGKNLGKTLIINQNYYLEPVNKRLNLLKICNCQGLYVESAGLNQFLTVNFL